MKSRPLAVALLVSLAPCVALPPRLALAQSATDDASTKMARQRFQEGVAFFDKHQYDQARAAFLQAYALRKHPLVLLNLAQSSLKGGHTLEAARYFQQFLHEYAAATQAQRSDAEAGLAEANTKLGRIDVSSAPAGAEVWIDDERAGMAPFDHPIEVEPGAHAVGARGRGGDESVQVTAPAGQVVTARFGAQPAPVAAAPVPAAPATPPPAPAETPAETPSSAPPADEPPPSTPAPAATVDQGGHSHFFPRHSAPVVVGGLLALAGFGTAIVMGVEKSSAQNSANSVADQIHAAGGGQGECLKANGTVFAGPCNILQSDNNKVNSDALIANIGVGVGVTASLFTVLYFALASRDDSTLPPSTTEPTNSAALRPVVTPMVGRGVGGLTLGASF